MKYLISLLVLTASLVAGAPVVTIDDDFNAIVNGVNMGKVGDVLVNNKSDATLAVAINTALMAQLAKTKADTSSTITKVNSDAAALVVKINADAAASVAKASSDAATAARTAKDAVDAATAKAAAADAAKAQADIDSAKLKVVVDSLKGLESVLPDPVKQAIADDTTKQKTDLEAQKAAIEAKLAKMK